MSIRPVCIYITVANMNDLRYSRQMIMPQVGGEGQQRLQAKIVLVVGAGGIGSTVALYLAGAGVATDILDFDKVEVSNLHRQIIHDESQSGNYKAVSAVEHMKRLNSTVSFNSYTCKLTVENAVDVISQYDLVVDATDNIDARYLINDCCVLLQKPLISGSAVSMDGQITTIIPYSSPCYRCLYPNLNVSMGGCRSCADAGVLGPVPGLIGCLQAMEALKLLLNWDKYFPEECEGEVGDVEKNSEEAVNKMTAKSDNTSSDPTTTSTITPTGTKLPHRTNGKSAAQLKLLVGRQLMYDGVNGDFHSFTLPARRVDCAVCGESPSIRTMADSAASLFIRDSNSCSSTESVGSETSKGTAGKEARETTTVPCTSKKDNSILSSSVVLSPDVVGLDPSHRITAVDFSAVLQPGGPISLILDVRSPEQFSMLRLAREGIECYSSIQDCVEALISRSSALSNRTCAVQVNVPLSELKGGKLAEKRTLAQQKVFTDLHLICKLILDKNKNVLLTQEEGCVVTGNVKIFTLCRRGVDSVSAMHILLKQGFAHAGPHVQRGEEVHGGAVYGNRSRGGGKKGYASGSYLLRNVEGGLTAWSTDVDPTMVMY